MSSYGPTSWVRLLTAVEERREERNDCRIMVEVKKHPRLGLLQQQGEVHAAGNVYYRNRNNGAEGTAEPEEGTDDGLALRQRAPPARSGW